MGLQEFDGEEKKGNRVERTRIDAENVGAAVQSVPWRFTQDKAFAAVIMVYAPSLDSACNMIIFHR